MLLTGLGLVSAGGRKLALDGDNPLPRTRSVDLVGRKSVGFDVGTVRALHCRRPAAGGWAPPRPYEPCTWQWDAMSSPTETGANRRGVEKTRGRNEVGCGIPANGWTVSVTSRRGRKTRSSWSLRGSAEAGDVAKELWGGDETREDEPRSHRARGTVDDNSPPPTPERAAVVVTRTTNDPWARRQTRLRGARQPRERLGPIVLRDDGSVTRPHAASGNGPVERHSGRWTSGRRALRPSVG